MIKYSGLIIFSAISLLLLIFKKLSIHTVPDKQRISRKLFITLLKNIDSVFI